MTPARQNTGAFLGFILCMCSTSVALAQTGPLVTPFTAELDPIDFLTGSDRLSSIRTALTEADSRRVRIYVYGASHTASDDYTSALRLKLQRRHHDGGLGWILPAMPFPFYRHALVGIEDRGWTGIKVRYSERTQDDYGLAGFAVQTTRRATATLSFYRSVEGSRLRLSYLQQPGGGTVIVEVGDHRHRIQTRGRRRTQLIEVDAALPAIETLTIRTLGNGPVRLFGVSVERAQGVIVDAFGVPGARADDQLPWRTAALRSAFQARPPDLVVFAYGTNESARRSRPGDRARLRQVIGRMQRLAPHASCLLIGPGEWPRRPRRRDAEAVWRARPRTAQVIRMQRAVAGELGCAFFDTFAWMGGEGSMQAWVDRGFALDDHVHFTPPGYALLGGAITTLLAP